MDWRQRRVILSAELVPWLGSPGHPLKTLWVRSEKPDRSWGVWGFRGKVRSDVIKVIYPESGGSKAEPPFWGEPSLFAERSKI